MNEKPYIPYTEEELKALVEIALDVKVSGSITWNEARLRERLITYNESGTRFTPDTFHDFLSGAAAARRDAEEGGERGVLDQWENTLEGEKPAFRNRKNGVRDGDIKGETTPTELNRFERCIWEERGKIGVDPFGIPANIISAEEWDALTNREKAPTPAFRNYLCAMAHITQGVPYWGMQHAAARAAFFFAESNHISPNPQALNTLILSQLETLSTFKSCLNFARLCAGLTHPALGEAAGFHAANIYRWLNEEKPYSPSAPQLKTICDVMGLDDAAHKVLYQRCFLKELGVINNPESTFGDLLKAHREISGYTENKLGNKVGALSTYYWENGRSLPTAETFKKICAALRLDVNASQQLYDKYLVALSEKVRDTRGNDINLSIKALTSALEQDESSRLIHVPEGLTIASETTNSLQELMAAKKIKR